MCGRRAAVFVLGLAAGAAAVSVPLAQTVPPRSIVVVSDLHMGIGRSAGGGWHPTEDFRWSAEFARFLDAVGQEGNDAVDLVVNGDVFELVNAAAGTCATGGEGVGCAEAEALGRLDRIVKAHDAEVQALGRFARAGSNRVVFVPGDQDAALLFPAVARRVVAALAAPDGRVEVAGSGYWLSADGQVYAEHGHQIGFSAHRFDDWPAPFIRRSGRLALTRPWGEILAQDIYGRHEERIPLIDNVAALGKGIEYVDFTDERQVQAIVPRLLRYVMSAFAWQQFRMELDDGDVQPPVWDIAAVRAQGAAFLVASLPDDNPLKPAVVKGLAGGNLPSLELKDEEIVALCDYRAAIRRSRRRFEPTLTQLAPRGPALAECPRTADTRGAAFEYFWRSRDQIFLRHLETVARALPTGRPPRVLVYGHTHLPDRAQTNANMISGGLLTIPMEGFSPVRGQLTPVVINAGAWQRTITPVQLDRRAGEAGVSPANILTTLQPDDLPGCYSLVHISRENDLPAPAVRYWRQAVDGAWGLGATCGAGN